MCYIFTWLGWTIDIAQRTLIFVLACCLCGILLAAVMAALAAGVAYGYNYSMAEFITFAKKDLTVYMRRGQFYDRPDIDLDRLAAILSGRRAGGGEADDFQLGTDKKPTDPSSDADGRRAMADMRKFPEDTGMVPANIADTKLNQNVEVVPNVLDVPSAHNKYVETFRRFSSKDRPTAPMESLPTSPPPDLFRRLSMKLSTPNKEASNEKTKYFEPDKGFKFTSKSHEELLTFLPLKSASLTMPPPPPPDPFMHLTMRLFPSTTQDFIEERKYFQAEKHYTPSITSYQYTEEFMDTSRFLPLKHLSATPPQLTSKMDVFSNENKYYKSDEHKSSPTSHTVNLMKPSRIQFPMPLKSLSSTPPPPSRSPPPPLPMHPFRRLKIKLLTSTEVVNDETKNFKPNKHYKPTPTSHTEDQTETITIEDENDEDYVILKKLKEKIVELKITRTPVKPLKLKLGNKSQKTNPFERKEKYHMQKPYLMRTWMPTLPTYTEEDTDYESPSRPVRR